MPKVSIIIPCFNLGKYIHTAIDSVLAQTFQDFEIIIVNDGSTDGETNQILDDLENLKIKVITTANQGLSNARNNGIEQAVGEYILPLDADDKIAPTYLEKAVRILDQNENIGIVYCRAEFFGVNNAKWELPDYELMQMLIDNMIFCSAFFRKADWKLVGGFKPTMIYGWEDYDFWLSIIELKREVCRLPEYLFYYRQRSKSMINKMTNEHLYYSRQKIVENHKRLYLNNIPCILQHIYLLKGIVSDAQSDQVAKEREIINLNIEMFNLKAQVFHSNAKMFNLKAEISDTNLDIFNLNAKIFNNSLKKFLNI